jgi:hypothetical protein
MTTRARVIAARQALADIAATDAPAVAAAARSHLATATATIQSAPTPPPSPLAPIAEPVPEPAPVPELRPEPEAEPDSLPPAEPLGPMRETVPQPATARGPQPKAPRGWRRWPRAAITSAVAGITALIVWQTSPPSHSVASGSHDGTILATSSATGKGVQLWNAATGKTTHLLPAGTDAQPLAFSPADDTLATGDDAATVRLWDASSGRQLAVLPHTSLETFSPDGKLLAMIGLDNKVLLRNMATGTTTVLPGQPGGKENDLQFSPTGKFLAAASSDTNAWLWPIIT